MSLRSLRLRLLLGAALAIFIALLVAWAAMTLLFARHVERRDVEELNRSAVELLAGLHFDAAGKPYLDAAPTDGRFQRAAGGLYWQVTTPGGDLHSVSLWDQNLPAPLAATSANGWRQRTVRGPFEDRVLLIERQLTLSGGRAVALQLAGDDASSAEAQSEFSYELTLFLLGLWLILSLAAAVQVQLGLRPLTKVRASLDRLRRNPTERLQADLHPPEIAPLSEAINRLAEAREQDLVRARRRSADLAHGLKTPLSIIAAQSRRLREPGASLDHVEIADALERASASAGAILEAELARDRAALARASAAPVVSSAREISEQVVRVLEHTEAGAKLVFSVQVPDAVILPVSPQELREIIGALGENAVRFASRQVQITAGQDGAHAWLAVADDGPGLNEAQVAHALSRGTRLDEHAGGHGLGLSIVSDLMEARDGRLELDRAETGGLLAKVSWPTPEGQAEGSS